MKKISILLLITVVLLACDDNESLPINGGYFPLHVGDSWEFTTPDGQNPPKLALKREITKIVTINRQQYYLMTSQSVGNHLQYVDTTYYRVNSRGYVYSLRNNQDQEVNPFRLAVRDGTSWKYGSSEGMITLHQFETIQLDQAAVDSCKVFGYDDKKAIDEEYYITLGPGLGIVSQGSYAWGGRYDLKKATINGRTFEF